MSLSEKSKGALLGMLTKEIAKPLIKRLGDRMAKSKRPFIRATVAFFRGKP